MYNINEIIKNTCVYNSIFTIPSDWGYRKGEYTLSMEDIHHKEIVSKWKKENLVVYCCTKKAAITAVAFIIDKTGESSGIGVYLRSNNSIEKLKKYGVIKQLTRRPKNGIYTYSRKAYSKEKTFIAIPLFNRTVYIVKPRL